MHKLQISILLLLTILVAACNTSNSSQTSTRLYFGDAEGLVYANNTLLPGSATITSLDGTPIQTFAYDSKHNIYVITYAGNVFMWKNNTWQLIGGGSLGNTTVFNRLAIDANDNIYAIANNGNAYVSTATNHSWSAFGNTLPSGHNRVFSIYANGNNIYIGTQYEVYVATYNSPHWNRLGVGAIPGDPDASINAISLDSNTGNLYAAMLFGDVYVLTSNREA